MPGGKAECGTCERRCKLGNGKTGFCKTKINVEGRVYALTYGNISSMSRNPIEKKPFFHFWPGSFALTVGSYGCNFTCPWCQNWSISKTSPDPYKVNYVSPERLVEIAEESNCSGTSFSFNEPSTSLFEYSIDVMKMAKQSHLYNTYVTNLYSTPEALKAIIENGCDAFCVNVKGDNNAVETYCGADVEVVWRNLRELRRSGKHIEIVTLVVPKVSSDEDILRSIATRIKDELGSAVPWHCTRYYSAYEASNRGLPELTPVKLLENAREIGLEQGLKHVYLGNVIGHNGENTYCHSCHTLLIERSGLNVRYHAIDRMDYSCSHCHDGTDIVGKCMQL